jgi:hypothetical protein
MGQTDWCTCPDYAIDPACPKHGVTPPPGGWLGAGIAPEPATERFETAAELNDFTDLGLTNGIDAGPKPESVASYADRGGKLADVPADDFIRNDASNAPEPATDEITVTDETHVFTLGKLADAVMRGKTPEGFTGTVTTNGDVIFIQAGDGQTVIVDSADVLDPATPEPAPLGVLSLQDVGTLTAITEEEGRRSLVLPITLEDAAVLYRELQDKVDVLVAAVMLREVTVDEARVATARMKRLLTGLNDIIVEATGRGRTSEELRDLAGSFTDDQRQARLYVAARRGMAQR